MTTYELRELEGRIEGGWIAYELTADGAVILSQVVAKRAGQELRRLMRSGDTYQEFYLDGTSSKLLSHQRMQKSWQRAVSFEMNILRTLSDN